MFVCICAEDLTQFILGTSLEPAELRFYPQRLQYSFHCPALYDSLVLGCVYFNCED